MYQICWLNQLGIFSNTFSAKNVRTYFGSADGDVDSRLILGTMGRSDQTGENEHPMLNETSTRGLASSPVWPVLCMTGG